MDTRNEGASVAISRRFSFSTENARSPPRASAVRSAAAVLAAAALLLPGGATALAPAGAGEGGTTTHYRYFGYGSNVIPSTMKALRGIDVRDVTPAVLPDHELAFAGAAFVRPVAGRAVHGLLYTLTADEFAAVGRTEGVPFGYRWSSCRVYPYRGDGDRAGADRVDDPGAAPVRAYALAAPPPAAAAFFPGRRDRGLRDGGPRPPSASYLGLMREGARLWGFDRAYQDELAAVEAAAASANPLLPGGWEGPALRLAEKVTGTKRTYMIDVCT